MPTRNRTSFDVVVVGAGPAGSLLARELARHDRTVLLIEKKKLPRYKACGGGLTRRARDLIPFDIEGLIEDRAHTTRLRVHYRTAFSQTADPPAVDLVMRDRFDHFFVRQARAAGAVIREQTRFLAVSGPPGNLTVETTRGAFRSGLIVGADGTHSRVARALGLPIHYHVMPALEAELAIAPTLLKRFAGSIVFDFGVIPGGYAWLFPKKTSLSAGILVRGRPANRLRPHLMRYLARNGLAGSECIRSLRLHPIPCRPDRRNRYADPRGLVVGDASGLVDPVTGEGLFYALKSAWIAAAVLSPPVPIPETAARCYTQAIKAHIEAEVLKADLLARILFGLPRLSNWILARCGPKIGAKHLAVYRGEMSYRRLFRYVMSPKGLAFLLRPPRQARSSSGLPSFSPREYGHPRSSASEEGADGLPSELARGRDGP